MIGEATEVGVRERERAFNRRFCLAVRKARDDANLTQAETAMRLGIPRQRYRRYESSTPMPHNLLIAFTTLTQTTIGRLFTAASAAD